MTRDEILCRYRHLRAINTRQQDGALGLVSQTTLLDFARRLGIARGRTLILDNPDEMILVFDLVVHTGKGGRSRAIDRYADKVRPPPGSDEAMMLDAARHARFTLWRVEQRHETVGLNVLDVVGNKILWLIDESLEASCPSGCLFAGRLMAVEDFVTTCGAMVPVDLSVIAEAWGSMPHVTAHSRTALVQDPRFAIGMFRAAIRTGATQEIAFGEPATMQALEAADVV